MTAIEARPRVDLSQGLLKAEEIAELLAVQRSTVFELSRRTNDPLPRIKLGGSVRFHLAAVESWLGRQEG